MPGDPVRKRDAALVTLTCVLVEWASFCAAAAARVTSARAQLKGELPGILPARIQVRRTRPGPRAPGVIYGACRWHCAAQCHSSKAASQRTLSLPALWHWAWAISGGSETPRSLFPGVCSLRLLAPSRDLPLTGPGARAPGSTPSRRAALQVARLAATWRGHVSRFV